MPLDGLTLNVLVNELEPKLKNSRVLKIYQPDASTITLHLRLPGETKILLISADAVHPRTHTIDNQPNNPLNPPAFCMLLRKYLEPSRLLQIEQQGFDRIVHFRFEAMDDTGGLTELVLIFELMGRQSNIYLVNKDGVILDALKRFPDRGIAPGQSYVPPSDQGKMDPTEVTAEYFINEIRLLPATTPIWKWIAGSFQGFSKVAAQELVKRSGLKAQSTRGELESAQWDRLQQAFAELLSEITSGGSPTHYPQLDDFAAYNLSGAQGELFSSVDQLISTVLHKRHSQRELETAKAELRRQLQRHLKRAQKKKAIHELDLQEAEHADQYRHQGELLTASFHLIPQGASSVQVPDYTQEGSPLVTVELDPLLTPSGNVERIFRRYRKAKARQEHAQGQLELTQVELEYLENTLLQIELAEEIPLLKEIEAELIKLGYLKAKAKRRSAKTAKPLGPQRYLSVDGLTILVGRNNRQNDELTFHLTRPNHVWLHARNIAGSHVSILAEDVPPETLLQAAQLAAYFSEQRKSPKVAVDYTLRKHVRKPKGAQPGFVHYEQAKTLLVNPTELELPPLKE